MDWIIIGYKLTWQKTSPVARELKNSKSSQDKQEFVTKAILETLEAGAASGLPTGVRPIVVSSLKVVSKPHSDMLRPIANMKYDNEHLAKRFFKLNGLFGYLRYGRKKGLFVYLLWPHLRLLPRFVASWFRSSRRFVGLIWKGKYRQYNCLPFGLSTAPWGLLKVINELVTYWRQIRGKTLSPAWMILCFL
jgi:hypothetical protein